MEAVNIFVYLLAETGSVSASMALQKTRMVERVHLVSAEMSLYTLL